jgi:preprotein translocase subunit YajC
VSAAVVCNQPTRSRTFVSNLAPFLILLGIALLFWVVMIRPARRQQQQIVRQQGHLAVGDEVMLTSGIFGSVRSLDDETVSLDVADGVTLKVARAAVRTVVTEAAETPEEQPADNEGGLVDGVVDESEEK